MSATRLELVSLHPDVLLAQGSLPITLLRRHTSTIPIVFTIVADPLGQGFVEKSPDSAALIRR